MEEVINGWHQAVNSGDLIRAAAPVGEPLIVLGSKGAGPIFPSEFADGVDWLGIWLMPPSWHLVNERLMVVEEETTWPENQTPVRVARVFRVAGATVTAALRMTDLRLALDLAYICREMAKSE